MKRLLAMAIVLSMVMVLFAACGSDPTPPAPTPTPPGGDNGETGNKVGGVLRVAFASNLETPDPQLARTGTALNYSSSITDALFGMNEDGSPRPLLAREWECSPDGLELTIHLQENVKFHDGEPFNAEAVRWNIQDRLLNEDFSNNKRPSLLNINDVEVVSDYTLIFHLDETDAILLETLTGSQYGMVSPKAVQEMGEDFADNPVGLGPFVFKEFIPDSHARVERFDDYWQGAPYLDAIEFKIIPEESTRVLELEMGNVDVLLYTAPREAARLESDFNVVSGAKLGLVTLAMNLRMPVFQDIRMRQALGYAMDRQLIIDEVNHGYPDMGAFGIPPDCRGFDPTLENFDYDPEKAGELLDDLGWVMGSDGFRYKDGEKLEFVLRSSSAATVLMTTEVVQQMLADVGIDSEIYMTESAAFNQDMRSENFEIGYWGLGGYVHPGVMAFALHSDYYWNPSRHYVEEIDSVIDQAMKEMDDDRLIELTEEYQRLIKEHLPAIHLWHAGSIWVMNPRVNDIFIDAANYMYFEKAWVSE